MRNSRVARRYARALMSAAEETGTLELTSADLVLLEGITRSSREFRLFLTTPVVSVSRKTAVVRELLAGRTGAVTLTFIELLIQKQREPLLPDIIEQYAVLRDDRLGIINVDVTSAAELTAQQQQTLRTELERFTHKNVRVRLAIDVTIRGGLVVRIGDTVYDASLTRQLERLRECFVRGASLTH
jgi:F-type H+-transporting ATPase subunit delta